MLSDLKSQVIESPKFAVLLNARAKRWTGDLHEQIQRWVPAGDLFLTDDFIQAERTLDRIVDSEYDVIFTGGGDGTIMYLMNAIEKRVRKGMVDREKAPPAGVLKMGTGNAMATYFGCQSIVDDLESLRGGAPLRVYDTYMVQDDKNIAFPFAGFGWDSILLNDYDAFKEAAKQTPFENYVTGMFGYGVSVVTRSIPTAVKKGAFPIRVTARGPAEMIDQNGKVLESFESGDVIFEGDVKTASIGSIANWGFSIRMFPFATQKEGYAHLRLFNGRLRNILKRMDKFWKGSFAEGDVVDFIVTEIDLEILDGPVAYHVAGDPCGYERNVRWKVTDPVKIAVVEH